LNSQRNIGGIICSDPEFAELTVFSVHYAIHHVHPLICLSCNCPQHKNTEWYGNRVKEIFFSIGYCNEKVTVITVVWGTLSSLSGVQGRDPAATSFREFCTW